MGKAVPRAMTREPGDLPLSASSAVERVGSMVRPSWAVTFVFVIARWFGRRRRRALIRK
jgi:hypothetical protein